MFARIGALVLVVAASAVGPASAQSDNPSAQQTDSAQSKIPLDSPAAKPQANVLSPTLRKFYLGPAYKPPADDQPQGVAPVSSDWGWCVLVDPQNNTAYYSSVFAGEIYGDWARLTLAYKLYISGIYPGAGGSAYCNDDQYTDADYQSDRQKKDQYTRILQNYKIVKTSWEP